jgi:hypothetical protein
VYKAAAVALQHTLGDLELVFADNKTQQLLLDLPHAALLQLLRDERTRVASENTAAHAVLQWASANNASTEQMKQLVRAMLNGICRQGIAVEVLPDCCFALQSRNTTAEGRHE